MVDPSARYEDVKIPLRTPVHGLEEVPGVLGIPEWWPTGSRVGVVIGHGGSGGSDDPIVAGVHRGLTERGHLTLRFDFAFYAAGKHNADREEILEAVFREALLFLGRDPTAAPAHLFVGGKNLGARVAAQVAVSRVRAEGLFFLGYPLHAQDKPDQVDPEHLFRVISPMLFVQGSRDRRCDLDVLRRTLSRVGAPTTLHVVQEADHVFRVLKKSGRTVEDVLEELLMALETWMKKVLEG